MSLPDTTTFFRTESLPNSIAILRIQRDLNQIQTDTTFSPIIFASQIDDNFLHIEAAISGPSSTPYENGVFLLDIKLSAQYPVRQQQQKVFHLKYFSLNSFHHLNQ